MKIVYEITNRLLGVEISAGPGPVDSTSGLLGPHLAGPPGQ